jgi:hypothetical protein
MDEETKEALRDIRGETLPGPMDVDPAAAPDNGNCESPMAFSNGDGVGVGEQMTPEELAQAVDAAVVEDPK